MANDPISAYFFIEHDPSGGGRAGLRVQSHRLHESFSSVNSEELVGKCVELDASVRNERNYNMQVGKPFESQVCNGCLELVAILRNLPSSTPEKDRFKQFLTFYFTCLADNRPFADNDTADGYLEAFRVNTNLEHLEAFDPALFAFIIVCSFSILMDMIVPIAYTSGMTEYHSEVVLEAMQQEVQRLQDLITRFLAEGDFSLVPIQLRELVRHLATDQSNFLGNAYLYYMECRTDQSAATTGITSSGLDGVMCRQIATFNQRIGMRDIGLMKLTYGVTVPDNIRRHFCRSWQWYRKNFWCLARKTELCDGAKVLPNVEMIIAFRGSWNVMDWITDFTAIPVSYRISDNEHPAWVHWGFKHTLDMHWKSISKFIDEVKKESGSDTAHWKFRVAGHSLGASWARLAALKIHESYSPIHKIHLNLAAYPGVFFRAQSGDAKRETLIIRNFYLKYDIVVNGGSLAMIRDLPAWQVCPNTLYLPIGSHFIFNIEDIMALGGEEAPHYNYQHEHGFVDL